MTAVKDTGPLDWRIAIVDKTGRPTQEFQRKWATQRANNALIGSITFGTGTPTGMPDDGAEYVDTTKEPWVLYIGENGTWNVVGVQDFIDLDDVPGNYTGSGGKLVRVTGNATGLEFDSPSSVLDSFGNATGDILYRGNSTWEVLTPGTAAFVLTTGGPGTPPVWAAGGGGGGGGALALIDEVITSGSQSTVTFSSIPNTYRDLIVRVRGRGDTGSTFTSPLLRFNGDTSSNYDYEDAHWFGSATSFGQTTGASSLLLGYIPAGSSNTGLAGITETLIADYRGTVFFKSTNTLLSGPLSTSSNAFGGGQFSGSWQNTNAITAVEVLLSAGNFVNGSVVSLYGSS